MRLLISNSFLFSFSIFFSLSASAYWSNPDQVTKGTTGGMQDAYDSLHSYMDRTFTSDIIIYSYSENSYPLSSGTMMYQASLTYSRWLGSGPSNLDDINNPVYGYVYSDEECQSLYDGSYTMPGVDINQDTINLGACQITQSGVTVGTSEGIYSDWTSSSTGNENQPGEGTLPSDSNFTPESYMSPVSECPDSNCVTVDGQTYHVDKNAIPSDGSISFPQDSDIIEFFPDGGYKLVHPDGSYEEMDASGTVTYHNPDGSIDPDGGSDSGSDGGTDSGSDGGDSGSPTDAGDIDFSDSSSGGGTTPGTSTDEEGNPEGMGSGDGDSTLGDVVGSITNLRNSLTGTLQEGFQGVVDKLTSTEGMPTEADATAMVNGEGAADDVMANLESQYEETNVALVEDYEGVFKDDSGILGQALSEVGDMATSLLPNIPTGGCSPLVFGEGEASFTIPCEVFDMIKAALSWILFFFTVYEVTSIGLGYRNNH